MSIQLTPQAGMRLMSASVFAYDFIVTLPSEYRLYRRQHSIFRPSTACIMFIAARYLGLAYIISTTVLFFSRNFTESSCKTVVPLGGFFRACVATTSAFIFLWRTWAIWQRNRTILLVMAVALIPQIMFSFPSQFMQVPIVNNGGCTGASGTSLFALKWPFALVNMLYDLLACVLGTWRLVLNIRSGVSRVSFILLGDGLGYFFLMLVVQTLNLAFLLQSDPAKQTLLVTFQAVLSSILSQRIITSLTERIELVPSSDHGSSHRDRSRSQSRSRKVFSRMPRPPAMTSTWANMSSVPRQQTRTDVEMVKIQIDVSEQVKHDMDQDETSSMDVKNDRGRKTEVGFV